MLLTAHFCLCVFTFNTVPCNLALFDNWVCRKKQHIQKIYTICSIQRRPDSMALRTLSSYICLIHESRVVTAISPAKSDEKMVKNAAFQEIFQLREQAKMVALLKIYSHFAIYRHRGRKLVQVQKTLFFFKRMRINLGFPQPQCHLWPYLFMQPVQHYLSQGHGWQHLCTHSECGPCNRLCSVPLKTLNARSRSRIFSQRFLNNLATTLLFMGRMRRDKICIACL